MEYNLSGFKQTGTWSEIVAHGELISTMMEDEGISGEAFEEWEHWRPKPHESLEDEVNKKTADKTTISQGSGEDKGRSGTGDVIRAGKKLIDSPKDAARKDIGGAGKDMKDSAGYLARAFDTLTRKFLRNVERPVYKHVMTQMSPLYFDNSIIAANLGRKSSLRSDRHIFYFEVGFTDNTLQKKIEERLRAVEEERDNS